MFPDIYNIVPPITDPTLIPTINPSPNQENVLIYSSYVIVNAINYLFMISIDLSKIISYNKVNVAYASFFQTRLKWSLHIGHSLLICGKNLVYEMFESNILFFIYVNVKKSDFSKESSTSRMMKLCNDTLLLLCCRSK